MQFWCSFRAVSEQFQGNFLEQILNVYRKYEGNFRAVSEQFECILKTNFEKYKGSFRAVSEQFLLFYWSSSFSAILEHFKSSFRAISEQFRRKLMTNSVGSLGGDLVVLLDEQLLGAVAICYQSTG